MRLPHIIINKTHTYTQRHCSYRTCSPASSFGKQWYSGPERKMGKLPQSSTLWNGRRWGKNLVLIPTACERHGKQPHFARTFQYEHSCWGHHHLPSWISGTLTSSTCFFRKTSSYPTPFPHGSRPCSSWLLNARPIFPPPALALLSTNLVYSARMFLSVFFLLRFYGNQTHLAAFCSPTCVPRSPAKWPELTPLSNPACPSPIKKPEWEMTVVCKLLSQQKQSEGKDKAKSQHPSWDLIRTGLWRSPHLGQALC